MSERIGLTHCINPNHNDKTPSMAVYDHGKDKLQVFCFGCKYYAWVHQENIQLVKPNNIKSVYEIGQVTVDAADWNVIKTYDADIGLMVREYCTKRNLTSVDAQLLLDQITMGTNEPQGRPFMSWNIYNYNGGYRGYQRRFLDDQQPKTDYCTGMVIQNRYTLYTTDLVPYNKPEGEYDIAICESAFDTFWVKQTVPESRDTIYYTTLGTPNAIEWEYKLKVIIQEAKKVYLYFDRDIPGYKTVQAIMDYWKYNVFTMVEPLDMLEGMPDGSKVYDIEGIE